MEKNKKIFLFALIPLGIIAGIVMISLNRSPNFEDLANNFFTNISKKNYAKAYSMTSKNFQQNISEDKFPEEIMNSSLVKLKLIQWEGQDKRPKEAILAGVGITKEGEKLPISILFEKQGFSWKIYGIQGDRDEEAENNPLEGK